MRRTFFSTTFFLLAAAAVSAQERAPFRAGQPDARKTAPQPESRAKIIDEIRSDLVDVIEKLNKNDAGAQTRIRQQRILKNIDKLLEQDDPPPSQNSNESSSSSSKPPPDRPPGQKPKPTGNSPAQAAEEKPLPKTPEPVRAEPKPSAANGQRESRPKTFAEWEKENARTGDGWELPPRVRRQMDAYSHDRFPPGYEDLLRAYYRALAESSRRE